ncbi:hypothetical protein CBER1_09843 [Cercospora berteroae]|uniref:Enoyl reductase (ER) domain-containing protein n=1 Tax=Cercospora berteroae TaxID=357750 RepID=A0A2S6BXZ4_9PEZI|nr:hypothetical protein CBER1_09843 [Cercospora berteroae]
MGDTQPSEEIPKTCIAGVVVNEGPNFHIEVVKDAPVPTPGPNQLLLRLNVTGLCASDIHFCSNDLDFGIGMKDFNVRSPGHEGAGVVVAIGAGVENWKVGDRAGMRPMWDTCHQCDQCFGKEEQYCPKVVHCGLMVSGSYQQYVLTPANYTSRIPDGVPDEIAGPIMCSASTMHCALREGGFKSADWVVFPGGGGGVGIQGVQLAKAMGMRPIVIDSGDAKKELALRCGAEIFLDFKEEKDLSAKVKEVTGGIGAHGVVVTAWQSYKDSLSYLGARVGGKVVCIGLPPAEAQVIIGTSPTQFIMFKQSVTGAVVGTMQDTSMALEYAKRGLLKPICEVRGISKWAESVEQLRKGQVAGRIVIAFDKE